MKKKNERRRSPLVSRCVGHTILSAQQFLKRSLTHSNPYLQGWAADQPGQSEMHPLSGLGMDIWTRPGQSANQLLPKSFTEVIWKEMPSFLWDHGPGSCYNPRAALSHLSFLGKHEATPRRREMGLKASFEHLVQPLVAKCSPWTSWLLDTTPFLFWWVILVVFGRWKERLSRKGTQEYPWGSRGSLFSGLQTYQHHANQSSCPFNTSYPGVPSRNHLFKRVRVALTES